MCSGPQVSARSGSIAVLDVGTSRVKGALLSARGGPEVAAHVVTLPALRLSGWRAEQDADDILRAVKDVLAALASVETSDSWRALAMTTQRGTFMCVDAEGRVVAPLWSWLDRRGLEVGGDRFDWLQKNAALRSRVARIWSLASWLAWELTGESVETSQTMTPEAPRGAQDGLQVARIVAPGFIIHDKSGLPIICVGGDKNAELVGAGVVTPAAGAVSFGTALSLGVLSTKTQSVGPAFVTTSLIAGFSQWEVGLPNGGAVAPWLDDVLGAESISSLDGPVDGPLFVPYLSGSLTDRRELGAWVGLTSQASRSMLKAAGLEGWVLDLLRQQSALPSRPERLMLVGGAVNSAAGAALAEAMADSFQVPVDIATNVDAGVRGAAMSAGVALGLVASWPEARALWALEAARTWAPRHERSARWAARLKRYEASVEALRVLAFQS